MIASLTGPDVGPISSEWPYKHSRWQKKIISSTSNKTSSNATKQVYTKFWSMPNGLNYDSSSTSSWKAQREQRAQSEIIAKQRNFENEQSDRLIEKIRRKQKLSV